MCLQAEHPVIDLQTEAEELRIEEGREAMVLPVFCDLPPLYRIELELAVGAGHAEICRPCPLGVLKLFLGQGHRELIIDPSEGGTATFEPSLPGNALCTGHADQLIEEGRGDGIVKLDDGAGA
jgi:hypothetical protein